MLDAFTEQPSTSAESSRRKSRAEAPEASGEIGGRSAETSAELQAAIADKERLRDSLLKTYREEFKKYAEEKQERDAAALKLLELKMKGLSNVGDDDLEKMRLDGEALSHEELARADRYKQDAIELETEIQKLKDDLEGRLN